jgi:hypothetical protein
MTVQVATGGTRDPRRFTGDEVRLISSSPVPPREFTRPYGQSDPTIFSPLVYTVTMVTLPKNGFCEREAVERISINVPDHMLRQHARLNRSFRLVELGGALFLSPAPLNEDVKPLPVAPGNLIKIAGEGSVFEAKLRNGFLEFNRLAGIDPNEDIKAA